MARVGGGGGPRWVWPLIVILILVGLGLLAWAFLAPPAPGTQPTEQPTEQPAAVPTATGPMSIRDITADPSKFFGQDVTVEGRITRLVGDMGLYLVDRDGGSELLAVIDKRVSDTDLRNDDFGRFLGTIREVTDAELDRLSNDVDQTTRDALAKEKAYLSVKDFAKTSR